MEIVPIDHTAASLRLKELADLSGMQLSNLSTYFKGASFKDVKKAGNRVVGVMPNAVENLLAGRGFKDIYKPGVYIFNSQCGGVGKTTATINSAFAFSRLSARSSYPILILDLDSQASATLQLLGEIDEDLPVLVDYLEKRVESLRDLVIPIGENIFLLPSSLDNGYLQKHISSGKDVRKIGTDIIEALFKEFAIDGRLKIFIDSPPALSAVTHSFIRAANQLGPQYDKALCIPIRPDKFAIKGCAIALTELEETVLTYDNNVRNITVVPFISFYQQNKNSVLAMRKALENRTIAKYELASVVVRKSDDIPNRMMANSHIFSQDSYKPTPVAQDYQDLMLFAMGQNRE